MQQKTVLTALLNRTTIGYMSSAKNRRRKGNYLGKVDRRIPEYNDLRVLKDVPDMTSNQIGEAINRLERLKGLVKRATCKQSSASCQRLRC